MRILYVIESISKKGGLERVLIDKLNYLANHTANEIILMTVWHDTHDNPYSISNKVRKVSLNVPVLPVPSGYILSLPLVVSRFNREINSLSPDVAIFFRAVGAFLIWRTNWKGKKIFESHQPVNTMNHKWVYPLMEKKVDVIVCLTKGDAVNFKIVKEVRVIPNFTNIKRSDVTVKKNRCIAVGRLSEEKNFSFLIDIWNSVNKKHSDWKLDIFGDGPEHERLQHRIDKLRLNNVVSLCGNTDNISEEYSSSEFLIMTSRFEGFGLVLIEAAVCGVPSVAFDCPDGPKDIIENGINGYLIPQDDEGGMVNAICKLIENEDLRQRIGKRAKDMSLRFMPSKVMGQWLKLFSELKSNF